MGIYIRNGHLQALREYKYAGQDKSLVSKYVLNPFWTRLASYFPANMAPNAITLTGFAFVVINFLTLLVYTPTLMERCPAWVYVSWGVGLFLYQTFDAIDGKQARRLGLSGPLGECFDHGVDALNVTVRGCVEGI
jgi:ethanolaminephosphotransferase